MNKAYLLMWHTHIPLILRASLNAVVSGVYGPSGCVACAGGSRVFVRCGAQGAAGHRSPAGR